MKRLLCLYDDVTPSGKRCKLMFFTDGTYRGTHWALNEPYSEWKIEEDTFFYRHHHMVKWEDDRGDKRLISALLNATVEKEIFSSSSPTAEATASKPVKSRFES